MGYQRFPDLDFSIDNLLCDIAVLRNFIRDPDWMTAENHKKRRIIVNGLKFVMLNLSAETDQGAAWDLYHRVMDEYHEICDRHQLAY